MGGDDDHHHWDHDTQRHVLPAFRYLWSYLVVADEPTDASAPVDALFCFGSRHDPVPHRAAHEYHAGTAGLVLCTGGPSGPGEDAEADRFATELRARGVPEDAIVREPHATNTGENVRFGLDALRARIGQVHRLGAISWPLSARRCRATFAKWAPEIEILSLPALSDPEIVWPPTPDLARWALGELARLCRYGDFGFIVHQAVPPAVLDAALILLAHLDPEPAPEPTPALGPEPAPAPTDHQPTRSAHDPSTRHVVPPGSPLVTQHSPLLDVQTLSDLLGNRGGEIPVRLRPPTRVEQMQPTPG